MAADFFERQDVARRNTTRLVLLFTAAVVGMIVSIDLLLTATLGFAARDARTGAIDWSQADNLQLLAFATIGTLAIIGGGSLYKIAQLRGGGHVVAESLGGRRLTPDTADPDERRLLNVVEEMAIASGIPAPPVFLMDHEDGINAFAAGFTPADAVIGVTRGTIAQLDRDELQGVVAHEFSHILNGDMRMNIRLMGLLHGILIIGMIGYFVLRSAAFAGGGRRRSRDGNPAAIFVIGAGLMAIGFVGTFFGNLIKAAVSRQREFLADASAVQFTRQPLGLAGALKKIGGLAAGSQVRNPNAPEASHLFFGRATSGMTSLFSTHPSLEERIRRVDPSWDGTFPAVTGGAAATGGRADETSTGGGRSPARMPVRVAALAGAGPMSEPAPSAQGLVAGIGQPTSAHLQYAVGLMDLLPDRVARAAREPYGARALIYALLLDRDASPRRLQLEYLAGQADAGVYAEVLALMPLVDGMDRRARLPVMELAIPALRSLTPDQYVAFRERLHALVMADSAIDLFEWSVQRIVLHDLELQFGHMKPARIRHQALPPILPQCELVLSLLAHVGHRDRDQARMAFGQAIAVLRAPHLQLRPREACGLAPFNEALGEIEAAVPAVKREVLLAAATCIMADRRITVTEAELLRAIAATLGAPMPPLLTD